MTPNTIGNMYWSSESWVWIPLLKEKTTRCFEDRENAISFLEYRTRIDTISRPSSTFSSGYALAAAAHWPILQKSRRPRAYSHISTQALMMILLGTSVLTWINMDSKLY